MPPWAVLACRRWKLDLLGRRDAPGGLETSPGTVELRASTGHDFEPKCVVTRMLDSSREVENWELPCRSVPFGAYPSWGFDLHVTSSQLSECRRLHLTQAERDHRFGLHGDPC